MTNGRTPIDTPAILVDQARLNRNIQTMAAHARHLGVAHWPHTKTHKVPAFAKLQLAAGSPGACVAKIGEAEVMADAGVAPIFIANHIVGDRKVRRVIELARRVPLAMCVDSLEAAAPLSQAASAAGLRLEVLLEVDTGSHRCGVQPGAQARELAVAVARLSGLQLTGIMTYAGLDRGGFSLEDLAEAARREQDLMGALADGLRALGLPITRVSGGSTPRARLYQPGGPLTEIRPGTYIYNDVNCLDASAATEDDCALTVLATVISRPRRGWVTLDAGSKALTSDRALSSEGHGRIAAWPGAVVRRLDEEHAYVELPADAPAPPIGERVRIIPNHVCPVSNLFDCLHLVDGDTLVERVPIAARGRSQ